MFLRNAGKCVKAEEQDQHQQSAVMKAFKLYAQFQLKRAKLQSSKMAVKHHTL
jgi:hypothetical protein